MSAVARLPVSGARSDETIDLVCPKGHRTPHSLARVLRLNDGWCGKCGVDISYDPSADADRASAGQDRDPEIDLPDIGKRPTRTPAALASVGESDDGVAATQKERFDDIPPAP